MEKKEQLGNDVTWQHNKFNKTATIHCSYNHHNKQCHWQS